MVARPRPGPGPLVPHRLVRGADPGPVDLQRQAVVAGHLRAGDPALDGDPPGCPALRPDPGAAGLVQPQPQVAAMFRVSVAAQQRRVSEPLLEQPDRLAGQVQALGGGPALDIGQQDDGVPGPVDVAGHQVVDAVGDDAGVDAEQQPVGDHHVQAREQVAAGLQDPAALADHVVRAAQVLPECDDADGARPGQQPAQVILAPAVLTGCRPRPAAARAFLCAANDSPATDWHALARRSHSVSEYGGS